MVITSVFSLPRSANALTPVGMSLVSVAHETCLIKLASHGEQSFCSVCGDQRLQEAENRPRSEDGAALCGHRGFALV